MKCLIASRHFLDGLDLVSALNRLGVFHIKRARSFLEVQTELNRCVSERCVGACSFDLIIIDRHILSLSSEVWLAEMRGHEAFKESSFMLVGDHGAEPLIGQEEGQKLALPLPNYYPSQPIKSSLRATSQKQRRVRRVHSTNLLVSA